MAHGSCNSCVCLCVSVQNIAIATSGTSPEVFVKIFPRRKFGHSCSYSFQIESSIVVLLVQMKTKVQHKHTKTKMRCEQWRRRRRRRRQHHRQQCAQWNRRTMHTHGHSQTPNNALHTGNTDGPCTYRVRHVRICIMWCMRRREFYFELDWVLQVGEFPKLFRHFRGQRCIVCFQRERTHPRPLLTIVRICLRWAASDRLRCCRRVHGVCVCGSYRYTDGVVANPAGSCCRPKFPFLFCLYFLNCPICQPNESMIDEQEQVKRKLWLLANTELLSYAAALWCVAVSAMSTASAMNEDVVGMNNGISYTHICALGISVYRRTETYENLPASNAFPCKRPAPGVG